MYLLVSQDMLVSLSYVRFEVSFLGGSVIAQLAAKWPFASVRSNMSLKLEIGNKSFPTGAALMSLMSWSRYV